MGARCVPLRRVGKMAIDVRVVGKGGLGCGKDDDSSRSAEVSTILFFYSERNRASQQILG